MDMERAATLGYHPHPWADLNSDLLASIVTATDGLSLRDYNCLRGVCTACWRSALPQPYPCVLSLANASPSPDLDVHNVPCDAVSGHGGVFVFSLPLRRSIPLGMATSSAMDGRRSMDSQNHTRTVISSANRLQRRILFNPELHSHRQMRVVGSGTGRFAVAIDHGNQSQRRDGIRFTFWTAKILLLSPRTGKEVELVPPPRRGDECVRKIVFAPDPDDGTVVALCDGKKIAYIDSGSGDDMKWTVIQVVTGFAELLVDLVFDGNGGGKVYCLDLSGGVSVLRIPRGGRNKQDEPAAAEANEPSPTLLSVPGSGAAFAPPYDTFSSLTFTKYLFFCHGSLYQMWQYTSGPFNLSSGFTLSADEVFVLRYDPGRCPYWNAVKELGGCSVFLGRNGSPTVVRAAAAGGAVPGWVRPDCVYWFDWNGVPMVCDVATGTSKPCVDRPYIWCHRQGQ